MKKREENQTMENIRKLFEVGAELTPEEVAERCHIAKRNAHHYINILKEERIIHVSEWMPYSVARYAIGDFPDAIKLSRQQRDVLRVMSYRRRVKSAEKFQSYQTKSIVSLTLGV